MCSSPWRTAFCRLSGAVLTLLAAHGLAIAATAPAPEDLLAAADSVRTPFDEGLIELELGRVGGGQRATMGHLDLYFAVGRGALAVFTEGPQQGRRILASGHRVWLLVPSARHAVEITGRQRLAGALAIEDLVGPPLGEVFAAQEETPEAVSLEGTPCLHLRLRGRSRPDPSAASEPDAELWSDAVSLLPRRLLLRLPSGRPARQIDFTAFARVGERTVASEIEVTDLLPGHGVVTAVRFLGYHRIELGAELFTVDGARGQLPSRDADGGLEGR